MSDIDFVFRIAAVGIIVAILNIILERSGRPEQAMLTTLSGLIVVLFMLVAEIGALFNMIKDIFVV
ncbi:MAG: stage III sporulation protein AC [Eubacteriales bacterium]|nr:stage III sporulation protein AC [Eubacteriales bacterium]